MFDYIKGTVTYIKNNAIVIETGGVGYLVYVANPYSFEIGQINSNITARLKIVYQYPSNATRTDVQISYSNTFIIYGQTATVSYRKHYIGINNPSPADDAVIDITTTQGRDKIKFSDGTNIIIELDLSKVYDDNNAYPAITVKKGTTEYTLFFY